MTEVNTPPLVLTDIPPDVKVFSITHGGNQYEYERHDDGTYHRTTFLYDELSDDAKEKAREWFTSNDYYTYDDWYESVLEWYSNEDSFVTHSTTRPWFTPEKIDSPEFDFDRGQYCKIEGTFNITEIVRYLAAKYNDRKWNRLLKWCEDGTLDDLQWPISHNYHYHTHNHCPYEAGDIIWAPDWPAPDWLADCETEIQAFIDSEVEDIEREVVSALRREYEGMFEKEYVAENIRCNEYLFDEDGGRV